MSPLSPITAEVTVPPETRLALRVAADEGLEVVTLSDTSINEAACVLDTKRNPASVNKSDKANSLFVNLIKLFTVYKYILREYLFPCQYPTLLLEAYCQPVGGCPFLESPA